VSPYDPFPGGDPIKMSKTKTVHLWVDFGNQSLSFAPE